MSDDQINDIQKRLKTIKNVGAARNYIGNLLIDYFTGRYNAAYNAFAQARIGLCSKAAK
jgi:hypothetical protein